MPEVLLAAPALPLDDAGPYVAGAYVVFVGLILVYVAIMAAKLQRITRELGELSELAERMNEDNVGARNEVPVQTAGPAARLEPKPGAPGRGAEEAPDSFREQPPDSFEEAPVDV